MIAFFRAMWVLTAVGGIGIGSMYLFDLALFVVPPGPSAPKGEVLVISKERHLRAIDSAEAYCERCAYPTDWCRRNFLASITDSRDIKARLPYTTLLYWLSGASYSKWPAKDDVPAPDGQMI